MPQNRDGSPNGRGYQFGDPQFTPDDYQNFTDTDRLADSKINVSNPALQAIPPLRVDPPVMALSDILDPDQLAPYVNANAITFHAVGDTGGIKEPSNQFLVADKMVEDFSNPDPAQRPAFFYHLGDVVYYFGQDRYYYDQYYDPYRNYQGPIFAIPGNHDAVVYPHEPAASLDAFRKHFCADAPTQAPEAVSTARTTMTQPGVYFTLKLEPFAWIIGLYSNTQEGSGAGVISGDVVGDAQVQFLTNQLQQAAAQKQNGALGAVILAVHHPPFTGSEDHNPSPDMLADIDQACQNAGLMPDVILSGHAHLYERYTRYINGVQVPFVVAGMGGYYNLSGLKQQPGNPPPQPPVDDQDRNGNRVTLENYFDNTFGFLRLGVSQALLSCEFVGVSDDTSPGQTLDRFTLDLKAHTLVQFQRL